MKAIKIDVEKRTVSFIQISDSIEAIYETIGNDCNIFTCPIQYENNDALYCDDEALLNPENIKGAFIYPNWNYPIVSNAIILGTGEYGESIDCKSTLDEIKKGIIFIDRNDPNLVKYISRFS